MSEMLDSVMERCRIEAYVIEKKRSTTFEIDISKYPIQKNLIGKKVGGVFFLSGFPYSYRILKILKSQKEIKPIGKHPGSPDPVPPLLPPQTPNPNNITSPEPGPIPSYTYQQVENKFGIRLSGFGRGINITPTSIVLISVVKGANTYFVYHDGWESKDIYLYSGEGRSGDQTMTRGNLALWKAKDDAKPIHLLTKFSSREYYYQGIFELIDYCYVDQEDADGNRRKEYIFRLKRA